MSEKQIIVRAASIEALNQILADTMMLRDLYARLPFVDATFDTTLISLALHHCADPEGVLDEGIRVTRFRLITPGCRLVRPPG